MLVRPKPLLLGVFLAFWLSIQFFVEKCQAILRLRSGHAFKAILAENENSRILWRVYAKSSSQLPLLIFQIRRSLKEFL